MSGIDPTPLFVDTGPFYARFDDADAHHDRTIRLFEQMRTGEPADALGWVLQDVPDRANGRAKALVRADPSVIFPC